VKISRGFHSSINNRNKREHDQMLTMPYRGAVFARVFAQDSDTERVSVDTLTGQTKTAFSYPFASTNAWIRGQPEAATQMISIIGADTKDIQPIAYYDPSKSAAAGAYTTVARGVRSNPGSAVLTKGLAYRVLAPGEIDIGSRYAQNFFGMVDVNQQRGGLSHLTMTSLYSRMETPLLYVEGPAHVVSANLNDEIRYGTVRRSVSGASNHTMPSLILGGSSQDTTSLLDPLASQPFAKEYTVTLDWAGTPNKLLDHRQGIVTDDDGKFPRSAQTQKFLRARYRWFTASGFGSNLQFTTSEIDEAGNTVFETSPDATDGLAMRIPSGSIQIKIGGDPVNGGSGGKLNVQTSNDIQFTSANRYSLVAQKGFRINAPQGARGVIDADGGLGIKSSGVINIDTPQMQGITLGNRERTKYPVLVAHPEYLSTLNNYFSAQSGLSGTLATYGSSAAQAWAAVGGVIGLIDPSGVVLGLCTAAGAAAGQLAAQAPQVGVAVGQHLPRMVQMPAGYISSKTVSE